MSEANPGPHQRWNSIALALLAVSAACYGIFMLAPAGDAHHGWEVWIDVADTVREFADPVAWTASETENNLYLASFLVGSLLSVAGPVFLPVFRRSRPIWWTAFTLISMSIIGFSPLLFSIYEVGPLRGLWWLLAALAFHLTGLLCVRSASGAKKEI